MADHSDKSMFVSSPIDVDKWNRAKWCGVAYLHDQSGEGPPAIGLMFENEAAGREIFQEWRSIYGDKDTHDDLRISIIEGDVPEQEPGYFVHIGFEQEGIYRRAKEQGLTDPAKLLLALVTRFHRMNPQPGSPHLPTFKKEFAKHGRYELLPVFIIGGSPTPDPDLAIEKTKVYYRTVDEIDENDLDHVCLGSK